MFERGLPITPVPSDGVKTGSLRLDGDRGIFPVKAAWARTRVLPVTNAAYQQGENKDGMDKVKANNGVTPQEQPIGPPGAHGDNGTCTGDLNGKTPDQPAQGPDGQNDDVVNGHDGDRGGDAGNINYQIGTNAVGPYTFSANGGRGGDGGDGVTGQKGGDGNTGGQGGDRASCPCAIGGNGNGATGGRGGNGGVGGHGGTGGTGGPGGDAGNITVTNYSCAVTISTSAKPGDGGGRGALGSGGSGGHMGSGGQGGSAGTTICIGQSPSGGQKGPDGGEGRRGESGSDGGLGDKSTFSPMINISNAWAAGCGSGSTACGPVNVCQFPATGCPPGCAASWDRPDGPTDKPEIRSKESLSRKHDACS